MTQEEFEALPKLGPTFKMSLSPKGNVEVAITPELYKRFMISAYQIDHNVKSENERWEIDYVKVAQDAGFLKQEANDLVGLMVSVGYFAINSINRFVWTTEGKRAAEEIIRLQGDKELPMVVKRDEPTESTRTQPTLTQNLTTAQTTAPVKPQPIHVHVVNGHEVGKKKKGLKGLLIGFGVLVLSLFFKDVIWKPIGNQLEKAWEKVVTPQATDKTAKP